MFVKSDKVEFASKNIESKNVKKNVGNTLNITKLKCPAKTDARMKFTRVL